MKYLIITGGTINEKTALDIINSNNYDRVIAVDGGLEFTSKYDINVHYIIGDFDSVKPDIIDKYRNSQEAKILQFPKNKDYTDTHLAVKFAVTDGADDIVILGGTGTRLDHVVANIQVLKLPLQSKVGCRIIDSNNVIQLMDSSDEFTIQDTYGRYISLIPLTSSVEGINTKGLKYPIVDGCLEIGQTVGVSNELISEQASVQITDGILIVIQSRD